MAISSHFCLALSLLSTSLLPLCSFSFFQAFPLATSHSQHTGLKRAADLLAPSSTISSQHLPFPPFNLFLTHFHPHLMATPSCDRLSLLEKRVECLSEDMLSFSLILVGFLIHPLLSSAIIHLSCHFCSFVCFINQTSSFSSQSCVNAHGQPRNSIHTESPSG